MPKRMWLKIFQFCIKQTQHYRHRENCLPLRDLMLNRRDASCTIIAHDVTKIQTTKPLILLLFYFNDVHIRAAENWCHTNFCPDWLLGFVIEYARISKLQHYRHRANCLPLRVLMLKRRDASCTIIAHDVTKIQTTKSLILLLFYFNDVYIRAAEN